MIDQKKKKSDVEDAVEKVEKKAKQTTKVVRDEAADLQASAQQLYDQVGYAVEDAQETITTQLKQRPFVVLGAAIGVGYVLGGGLPTFLTRALLRVGMRAATTVAVTHIASAFAADE